MVQMAFRGMNMRQQNVYAPVTKKYNEANIIIQSIVFAVSKIKNMHKDASPLHSSTTQRGLLGMNILQQHICHIYGPYGDLVMETN